MLLFGACVLEAVCNIWLLRIAEIFRLLAATNLSRFQALFWHL
jgi:hypothetical protein